MEPQVSSALQVLATWPALLIDDSRFPGKTDSEKTPLMCPSVDGMFKRASLERHLRVFSHGALGSICGGLGIGGLSLPLNVLARVVHDVYQ